MVYTPDGLDAAASAEMRASARMATRSARPPHAKPSIAATFFGIPKNVNHKRPITKAEMAGRDGLIPKPARDPPQPGKEKGVVNTTGRGVTPKRGGIPTPPPRSTPKPIITAPRTHMT